jgi:hypothetical protein
MDINRTSQVSPFLSAQRTASNHAIAAVKLANTQVEAEGAAALALIQSIPQSVNRVGTHINLTV